MVGKYDDARRAYERLRLVGGAHDDDTRDEEQESDKTLPLVWFRDIQPVLDVRDFVQGVFVDQALIMVYGPSNAGKTFWLTDLSLHIAAGLGWCGRRVEQSGVVYVPMEGGHGFRNRVAAWKAAHDMADTDLPFVAIPSSLNLMDADADVDALIAAIKAAGSALSVPVRLVVIDTLARSMAGGNENDPQDMGDLIANADRIRQETGAAVAFIHHSGKDEARGGRGHSSRLAAADTEIHVTDGEDGHTATVEKQRDLPKGDVFRFDLKVIELGHNRHGEAVTTCIVEHDAAPQQSGPRLSGQLRQAYAVLQNRIAASGQRHIGGVPADYLSIAEDAWREAFYSDAMPGAEPDTKKKAFRRAADKLSDMQLVGTLNRRVWLC